MNQKLTWTSENLPLPELPYPVIEEWVEAIVRDHGRVLGRVGYVFCDDERILEVNREFLQHDYYTDIITFDYDLGRMVRGDIYISLDTVRTNAELVGAAYERELRRVIIHGILHLCGIDDKAPGAREIMEAHEDRALAMLDKMN